MIKRKLTLLTIILLIANIQLFALKSPAVIETETFEKDINLLNKKNIIIDKVTPSKITVYIDDKELNKLRNIGLNIYRIPYRAKEYADSLYQATKDSKNPMWFYHDYNEMTAELDSIANAYPDITKLISIGQSVQGRELWFMKITDNPDYEEDEPEFKYIANMHGDEPPGREFCIYLIHWLVENYGVDIRATKLVNEAEIWIMPSMNPDGFELHQRCNANGIDLNRDFPDRITDPINTPDGRALETQAVMNWAFEQSSVLSANLHTGALVVNYPYDSAENFNPHYEPTPDDSLFIDISEAYSIHNTPMWNSPYFYHGITNGAAWYVIYGGMQDWNYVWMGDFEVTIEQSNPKWPNASWLQQGWLENQESMITYMEFVFKGIRGIVTDSTTGEPLFATVKMVGNDHEVFTDPDVGNYHRMLSPGVYDITVSSYGFIPQTITNITVLDTGATRVDVELQEAQIIDITGTVRDGDTSTPIGNATVQIMDSVHDPVQTDFTGFYAIDNVLEGTYTFKVSAAGYSTLTEEITVTQDNNVIDFELFAPYLFWNFEPDDGGFTSNDPSGWQWGEPSAGGITAYSGIKVWATNLSGFYIDNAHWYLDSPEFLVPNNSNLLFYHYYDFEGSDKTLWDGGNVKISTDGGTIFNLITPIGGYDGTISALGQQGFGGSNGDWEPVEFDLGTYADDNVIIRWHFASDGSQHNYYGWYVDDVAIIELAGVDDPAHGNELILHQNFPNPFTESTTISYNATTRLLRQLADTSWQANSHELSRIKIYNVKGQLVRELLPVPPSPSLPVSVTWDGKDMEQKSVSSGVYFYQVQTKNYSSEIKKMIYLQK